MGKDRNNKFNSHNPPNRNVDDLADFSLENQLARIKIKLKKNTESLAQTLVVF